jgi:hypothetical protein
VLEKEKESVNETMCDLRRHLKALKKGEQYISPLKAKGIQAEKRTSSGRYGSRPAKRQKFDPVGNDKAMSEDESAAPSETSNGVGSDWS